MKLRTSLFCSLLGAASLLGVPASAAGISLGITPAQGTVSSGQTTLVDLTISGLGNMTAPSLGAWDLDLHFDPTLLSIENTQFGSDLNLSGLGSANGTTQPSAGDLHLYEISYDSASALDSQQPGLFTLAGITMIGQQPGTSLLSLSVNDLSDSNGNPLTAGTISGASLQVTSGPMTASPEPAIPALLGAGMLLLVIVFCKQFPDRRSLHPSAAAFSLGGRGSRRTVVRAAAQSWSSGERRIVHIELNRRGV